MKKYFALIIFLIIYISSSAQEKFTLSGYIKEKGTGETMVGVNVFVKNQNSIGTVSNLYGFYSITLPSGNYDIVFSYIGYAPYTLTLSLDKNMGRDIELKGGIEMEEILITDENPRKNIDGTDMGTVELSMETVKRLPALFGEVDLMKSLQLLPGISSASEGAAGLYIRGGGPDQNLVLLDEAIVFNTGHLFGFFSVFNSDAIKNSTVIKGSVPANYGGRLSSVIDIQMKEGNNEDYVAEGGIGLIASRFTIQGPIQKQKSSFIFSGRRTYALDLAQPFINKTKFEGSNYYFYDFNAKVNYRFSPKDRIYLSGYFGRDVFKFQNVERDFRLELPYGNATATLRWNHIWSDKIFSNFSLITNNYDFGLHGGQEAFQFNIDSGVRDLSAKADLDYYPNPYHQIKTGFRYTYHKLSPNVVNATNGEVDFSTDFEPKYGHEFELYFLDEWSIRKNIKLNAGIRLSGFKQVGPYYSSIQKKEFAQGEHVKSYFTPEPRILFNYGLDEFSSLKSSVNLSSQYIHLVSNSGSTLPADVWVPSTELIKPQLGLQYSLGYFRNFSNNEIECSVEFYFKDLRNQLDYRETYVENFNADIETEFVSGEGRAYGMELYLRKNKGRFTGWIAYTLSKTERWFDEIENGRIYPAVYDRPHDLSLVMNYGLSKNWDLSAAFIYATGKAFTPIKSLFIIEGRPNVEYGPRNSQRLEDYHRLDLSLIYEKKEKRNKTFHSSWAFSIYNVYNHRNPFFTYTDFSSEVLSGKSTAKAYKVSIFTIIPSVTWNFYWNISKN